MSKTPSYLEESPYRPRIPAPEGDLPASWPARYGPHFAATGAVDGMGGRSLFGLRPWAPAIAPTPSDRVHEVMPKVRCLEAASA